MKIYLAGPCDTDNRTMMVKVARLLREGNIEVYCPWELKIPNAWDMTQEEWARKVFEEDIKAIKECEVFFMISHGRVSTAGTNWENGYAYALNKHIIIIQVNDEQTSLMTYSSASEFFLCHPDELVDVVKDILDDWAYYGIYHAGKNDCYYGCRTVLT